MEGAHPADRAALVGGDLMFRSRLTTALASTGVTVAPARAGEVPDAEFVFVDLNTDVGARLEAIERIHAARPAVTIVGFCHHRESGVRRSAMRCGATQVVTNAAIGEAALRIVTRGHP